MLVYCPLCGKEVEAKTILGTRHARIPRHNDPATGDKCDGTGSTVAVRMTT